MCVVEKHFWALFYIYLKQYIYIFLWYEKHCFVINFENEWWKMFFESWSLFIWNCIFGVFLSIGTTQIFYFLRNFENILVFKFSFYFHVEFKRKWLFYPNTYIFIFLSVITYTTAFIEASKEFDFFYYNN